MFLWVLPLSEGEAESRALQPMRVEFCIARSATPTSAKSASHIGTLPNTPSDKNTSFTPSAKTIFCTTIFLVYSEISCATQSFEGSSFFSMMSGDSIAASEPSQPIATPISAIASMGASFIPSPRNASAPVPDLVRSSRAATLSCGRREAR